jgi:large subunit ribosomal protein L25
VYGTRGEEKAPEAVPVAVDPREVLRILHSESGANTLINLRLDGRESRVMLKEFQLDPVTNGLLHADFYQLAMDRAITVTVPIHLKGESRGVKTQGGLLDFVTREIEVECLPTEIPDFIEVDVSAIGIHEAIHLNEVQLPDRVTLVSDPGQTIVTVLPPTVEEVKPTVEAAEAVAPAEGAAPEGAPTPATEASAADKGKKGGGEA